MKIKLRKENDFWGLIPPSEASNAPLLTLNHLNPKAEVDLNKLPEWAVKVIEKSAQYGVIILVEEKKEEIKVENGVKSTSEKPLRKRAPKKNSIKQ